MCLSSPLGLTTSSALDSGVRSGTWLSIPVVTRAASASRTLATSSFCFPCARSWHPQNVAHLICDHDWWHCAVLGSGASLSTELPYTQIAPGARCQPQMLIRRTRQCAAPASRASVQTPASAARSPATAPTAATAADTRCKWCALADLTGAMCRYIGRLCGNFSVALSWTRHA